MKKKCLGNTHIEVSAIGLGTVKLGRFEQVKYPVPFTLPNDQAVLTLLKDAKNWGINLIDTAPAYGNSESRLGQLLPGARTEWVISTKVGEFFEKGQSHYDFSEKTVRASIDHSLMQLRTDYLDIVLVHSDGRDTEIISQGIFDVLSQLKKIGKIRAYGMSTKTIAGAKLTIDHADVVMMTYNLIETENKTVIQYAHEKNKGVFIKKALASGHLNQFNSQDPIKTALDFVFREPGIHSVIVGTLNPAHLKEIVTAC